MKQKKWAVERCRTIQALGQFIKKFLKVESAEQLFIYVNQSFAPSPDQDVGTLYEHPRRGAQQPPEDGGRAPGEDVPRQCQHRHEEWQHPFPGGGSRAGAVGGHGRDGQLLPPLPPGSGHSGAPGRRGSHGGGVRAGGGRLPRPPRPGAGTSGGGRPGPGGQLGGLQAQPPAEAWAGGQHRPAGGRGPSGVTPQRHPSPSPSSPHSPILFLLNPLRHFGSGRRRMAATWRTEGSRLGRPYAVGG
ncbi:ubiquitin-like protein ATG12 isoform X1 [Heterodontus francisci]|uniref:ubiquitin-like protein ATG12 isoform X1 n=1 Tax=Heterodontus francisci TaxID=7792 RepID=UPI00355BB970